MRPYAVVALLVSVTGCVTTNAAVLDPTVSYQKICPDAVQVFTTPERVPSAYREVALLNSKGESSWTDEKQMMDSQRRKAAKLGANGIILGETKEPNAGTKIIGSLFGTGAERKGRAIAIYIPADSLRVKVACSGQGGGSRIAEDDDASAQPNPLGAPAPAAQPRPAAVQAPPPPLVEPSAPAEPPRLQDADRLPAADPQPVQVVQPVARDSVLDAYRAATTRFPPLTRYVADLRSRRYYGVGCRIAVEIPEVERYYYQTEAAAQADGHRLGECR